MSSINKHKQYLEQHNIKSSVQRLMIYDYLATHKTHPTVDQIYEDLINVIPTLSKTTVYNTLKMFVNAGITKELTIDGNTCRYDGETTPHAHFRCCKCSCIFDMPSLNIDNENVPIDKDFILQSIDIYYCGVCKNCNNK